MLEIAKFSGAKVVGLNPCEYQLKRVRFHIEQDNMQDQCSGVKVGISFLTLSRPRFCSNFWTRVEEGGGPSGSPPL